MSTLLMMYSSANSVFSRRKLGKESPRAIDKAGILAHAANAARCRTREATNE